jgi:hypothetical protein
MLTGVAVGGCCWFLAVGCPVLVIIVCVGFGYPYLPDMRVLRLQNRRQSKKLGVLNEDVVYSQLEIRITLLICPRSLST